MPPHVSAPCASTTCLPNVGVRQGARALWSGTMRILPYDNGHAALRARESLERSTLPPDNYTAKLEASNDRFCVDGRVTTRRYFFASEDARSSTSQAQSSNQIPAKMVTVITIIAVSSSIAHPLVT